MRIILKVAILVVIGLTGCSDTSGKEKYLYGKYLTYDCEALPNEEIIVEQNSHFGFLSGGGIFISSVETDFEGNFVVKLKDLANPTFYTRDYWGGSPYHPVGPRAPLLSFHNMDRKGLKELQNTSPENPLIVHPLNFKVTDGRLISRVRGSNVIKIPFRYGHRIETSLGGGSGIYINQNSRGFRGRMLSFRIENETKSNEPQDRWILLITTHQPNGLLHRPAGETLKDGALPIHGYNEFHEVDISDTFYKGTHVSDSFYFKSQGNRAFGIIDFIFYFNENHRPMIELYFDYLADEPATNSEVNRGSGRAYIEPDKRILYRPNCDGFHPLEMIGIDRPEIHFPQEVIAASIAEYSRTKREYLDNTKTARSTIKSAVDSLILNLCISRDEQRKLYLAIDNRGEEGWYVEPETIDKLARWIVESYPESCEDIHKGHTHYSSFLPRMARHTNTSSDTLEYLYNSIPSSRHSELRFKIFSTLASHPNLPKDIQLEMLESRWIHKYLAVNTQLDNDVGLTLAKMVLKRGGSPYWGHRNFSRKRRNERYFISVALAKNPNTSEEMYKLLKLSEFPSVKALVEEYMEDFQTRVN